MLIGNIKKIFMRIVQVHSQSLGKNLINRFQRNIIPISTERSTFLDVKGVAFYI